MRSISATTLFFLLTLAHILGSPQAGADCVFYADYFHPTGVHPLGGYARGLDYAEPYLYVVDDDHLLTILDTSDPAFLEECGALELSSQPRGLCVRGSIAYAALRADALQLVDVSNPSAPFLLGSAPLPCSPLAVAVSGDYAYVTAWEFMSTGEGVYVVDISDPMAPSVVTYIDVGGIPHNIFIAGDYAYIANSDLCILNIADPLNPVIEGAVDIPSTAMYLTNKGDYTFVVSDEYELCTEDYGLYVVNTSDPAHPVVVGSADPGYPTHQGITLWRHYAIVGTTGSGFAFIDISTPSQPQVVRFLGPKGCPAEFLATDSHLFASSSKVMAYFLGDGYAPEPVATVPSISGSKALATRGDYAYEVGHVASDFNVLDISDPEDPSIVGSEVLKDVYVAALSVTGDVPLTPHAYVSDAYNDEILVINIADPYAPDHVNTFPVLDYPSSLDAEGMYLYVTASDLLIYHLADPTTPNLINSMDFTYSVQTVTAVGSMVYVGSRVLHHHNLFIVDASDPMSPEVVGTSGDPVCPYEILIEGSLAYIADGHSGLLIMDISTPEVPTTLSRLITIGFARSVRLAGDLAYVTDYVCHSGMHVVDVSDPTAPFVVGFFPADGACDLEIINGHALVASARDLLQVAPLECDYSSTPGSETFELATANLTLAMNPSPANVSLALAMPRPGRAQLAMHDVQGRQIRELFRGSLSTGTHLFQWDGRSEHGGVAAAGVYFARLTTDASSVSQRIVLLR
ncbi:MAG: T9SS type A sorting domain-containing protein [Candidatus Eisenbacteria sp.]|nr:T9SS type A sorting domain-containing protein [Candidatus Eisenbacteria bacterium]